MFFLLNKKQKNPLNTKQLTDYFEHGQNLGNVFSIKTEDMLKGNMDKKNKKIFPLTFIDSASRIFECSSTAEMLASF